MEPNPEAESELKLNFMRTLVYCNTAMLMPDAQGKVLINDTESLTAALQAESPDEVALILAAAKHCGVLVTKRNGHEVESQGLNLYTDPSTEELHDSASLTSEKVELLAVNEFDSDRKMMSVLIRLPSNGRIFLYCKGADSSMLKNCDSRANPYTAHCSSHIDKFASTGLRTLVAAYREVSASEAESWLASYRVASNSITERLPLLSKCASAIETGMTLLGAVGIEDELQDGVPDAIEMLHCAGINVWMITGDKAETALAIGKKCNLINTDKQEVQRVVNLTGEALRQRIHDLHQYVMNRKLKEEREKAPGI